jgi:hypothetical protein
MTQRPFPSLCVSHTCGGGRTEVHNLIAVLLGSFSDEGAPQDGCQCKHRPRAWEPSEGVPAPGMEAIAPLIGRGVALILIWPAISAMPRLVSIRGLFSIALLSFDSNAAHTGVIPAAQHKALTKKARKTNHVEHFNNTLRQRIARLVRTRLSFSKQRENHVGAIRYFICPYNPTRTALLV